ncbi:MAG: RNA polymerase sigma factor RpoD/SigA [Candidatus Woesearchaeota archaeon]
MRHLKITPHPTDRSSPSLDKYFEDIRKYDLLNPEEETILASKVKEGDEVALEKLVNSNLRFVVSVAKQYQGQGLELPDLINEGNQGLIKAAEKYDETRGFRFISYAVWWIRQSIQQALADDGRTVRLPLNQLKKLKEYHNSEKEISQELATDPTPEHVLSQRDHGYLNTSTINAYNKATSLDDAYEDSGATGADTLEDTLSDHPDKHVEEDSRRAAFENVIDKLPKRYAEPIKLYYGFEGRQHDKKEIGKMLGLSPGQVNGCINKGERMLKLYKDELLDAF